MGFKWLMKILKDYNIINMKNGTPSFIYLRTSNLLEAQTFEWIINKLELTEVVVT